MRGKVFALLLLIFLFAGCSQNPQTMPKSLIPVTVAHWGHEKILIYLPLYVAMDAGLFKQQGLDVRVKYSGNDDQVFATVISGDAQFGVGDPTFTAISRERGGPGKVVATLVGRVANWGVTNEKDLTPIENPRQLNGLRVTSFPSPSTTYTILNEIKSSLNLQGMKILQVTPGAELGALERDEADIAIMLEPQTSIAVNKGYRVVWSLAKYYGPFTLTGLTTSDDEIARHPEVVQKMVNGLQNALDFIHAHPDQTVQIAAKTFPKLPMDVVRDAVQRMIQDKTIPDEVRTLPDAWRKTLEIRHKVGDLKSVEAGLAAVDNSFAEKALRTQQDSPQSVSHRSTGQPSPSPATQAIQGDSRDGSVSAGPANDWTWRGWLSFIADIFAIVGALTIIRWWFFYRGTMKYMTASLLKISRVLVAKSDQLRVTKYRLDDVQESLSSETNLTVPELLKALGSLEKQGFIKVSTQADPSGNPVRYVHLRGLGSPKLKRFLQEYGPGELP